MGLAFHYLPNATKIIQNGLPQDKRWSISPLANLGAYNLILHGCHATSYSSKIWQSGSKQYVNEIFNVSDLRLQIHFLWLEWTSFILSIRRSVDSRHSTATDVFGNRLFIKCDQEQPKRTTIKTHGDLILSSANLAGYDLVLHGCRHRIALKFGREALYNFWQRLPKFQAKSSKFIFMTGMNLVHSLNEEVIWLQTFIRYVWQSIIYRMRPRIAQTDHHKTHGDLISKVSQDIHDPRQIWPSFARLPISYSSKIW